MIDQEATIAKFLQVIPNNYDQMKNDYLNQHQIPLEQLYIYITTQSQLESLNIQGNVIGVDIEQTDEIGFDGSISLIQIKDDENVFIIDIILLKKNNVDSVLVIQKLSEIFTNKDIVKVFYAGTQDLLWLQRDLQIKLINYFDLKEIADKLPSLGKSSIINLWANFCNYHITKSSKTDMQQSDWDIRPLSQDQLLYAAQDCRYLPLLRQKLLNEFLLQKSQDEVIKLAQHMEKFTLKNYTEPTRSIQDFIKLNTNILKQIVHEAQELEVIPQIYLDLITSNNQKSLAKYIGALLMEFRQQYAKHHNLPEHQVDEDDHLVLVALEIIQKLAIQKLNNYPAFSENMEEYNNKQFDNLKSFIESNITKEWNDIKQFACKGIYQSYIYDEYFIKYSLTTVYNAENQTKKSKEKAEQKLDQKKQKQEEFGEKYTRKKPAYGNCKIMTKENFFLCNCDEKKIKWYLKQELADLVSEDPPTIKLRFDPSGFVEKSEDKEKQEKKEYITIERINQCVVCGCENLLLKYHIVPVVYKKHIQGKRTYDVVCLCINCHQKASAHNDQLKKEVAERLNVPLQVENQQSIGDKTKQLIKNVESYKKKSDKFPKDVKIKFAVQYTEVLDQLQQSQEFTEMNKDLLEKIIKQGDVVVVDQNFISVILEFKARLPEIIKIHSNDQSDHGKLTVDQLKDEAQINDFLTYWREEFLNYMKPQFLSEAWAIDHKYKRTFGEKSIFKQE